MNIFQSPDQRLAENKLYELVAIEIERGQMSKGVWAKAIAESGGGEAAAKSLYIKLRVQELTDELAIVEGSIKKQAQAATKARLEEAKREERRPNEEEKKRYDKDRWLEEGRKRYERQQKNKSQLSQQGNPEYKRHLKELRAAKSPGAGDTLKWIGIFIVVVGLLAIADS